MSSVRDVGPGDICFVAPSSALSRLGPCSSTMGEKVLFRGLPPTTPTMVLLYFSMSVTTWAQHCGQECGNSGSAQWRHKTDLDDRYPERGSRCFQRQSILWGRRAQLLVPACSASCSWENTWMGCPSDRAASVTDRLWCVELWIDEMWIVTVYCKVGVSPMKTTELTELMKANGRAGGRADSQTLPSRAALAVSMT
jgi:hypothetical protein